MDGMDGHDMGGHMGHDMAPSHSKPSVMLPEGEALRELPVLANESSTPGFFQAKLTAEPSTARFIEGHDTPILGYNGMSPGPLIEMTEGDQVEVLFTNQIPEQESTIHWHGMPVPSEQDGNPMDAVQTGTDRTYRFELPEGSAATYWYHPHPHGKTAEQVYRGLAGVVLVKPKVDPVPVEYGDTVLMFTDLRLAEDGTMQPSTMIDMMNGRVGDHVLINGQKNPVLSVPAGAKRRLRLINATNARYLRLSFENATMQVIGTDGGLLEAPVAAEEILLVPAERLEVIVSFEKPGAAKLHTLDYERGWMGAGKPDDGNLTLLTVDISETQAEAVPPLPNKLRPIAALGTPTVTRRLVFTETMSMDEHGMDMGFLINGKAFDMNRVDIVAKAGDVELWEIVNEADMDHPFHIHGTQFQVIEHERHGQISKAAHRAWKDTVNVALGETVRFLIRQDQVGPRMYHCHILEHEDQGMMGIVDVQA